MHYFSSSLISLLKIEGASDAEQLLNVAFGKLPGDIQTVLHLHYYENIPLKNIPPKIGKSLSAVRHLHRYGLFLLETRLKNQIAD